MIEPIVGLAILIIGMLLLMALGAEMFVAIGLPAAAVLIFIMNQSVDEFASKSWILLNSFTLSAVPLFTFLGVVLGRCGAVSQLFKGVDKFCDWLPGGVASTSIMANAVFGAISGSSVATVASFGSSILPEMLKFNYKESISIGSICMGGTLSVLIPPSVVLIVYGAYQEVSITRLFAGAMIPGIILAILYVVTVVAWVKLDPSLIPVRLTSYTWKDRLSGLADLAPTAGLILIILGSIFAGIMTPTEAAGAGALASMALAFIYKKLDLKLIKGALLTAVKTTTAVSFIIVTSQVFSYIINFLGGADAVAKFMLSLPFGKYGILTIVFIFYFIMGCLMHGTSLILLSLPFLVPIMQGISYDLVWLGVWACIVNELGLVTPPFGLNLFALNTVCPQYSVMKIAVSCFPFYPAVLLLVALCAVFPEIILWLPSILF